ncbi:MAG: hypothetical protein ACRDD1_17245, partial [Planctomycetia bacterium]
MPALCPHPNCGRPVAVDGSLPDRCPHCGLLLQPAARRRPTRPAAPPRDDRRSPEPPRPGPKVRVLSSRNDQDDDQDDLDDGESPEEVFTPTSNRPAPFSNDNPFLSTSDGVPKPDFLRDETPARAAKPEPRPAVRREEPAAKPKKVKKADDGLPFAAVDASSASRAIIERAANRGVDFTPYVAAAVVALGGAGFYYAGGLGLLNVPARKTVAAATGPEIRNIGRNYVVQGPTSDWTVDATETTAAVLKRPDVDGVLRIESGPTGGSFKLANFIDDTVTSWEQELSEIERLPEEPTTLGGASATLVPVLATLHGVKVRREATIATAAGLWYRFIRTAPVDEEKKVGPEFALAKASFKFLGVDPGDLSAGATKTPGLVASGKHPYQLRGLAKRWKEVPDLQVLSRFADVKLSDGDDGFVVVSCRETTDLDAMKRLYVGRQKRIHKTGTVTVREPTEELTLADRPAQRLRVFIDDEAVGKIFLMTTFVVDKDMIYQIEGRAPADKAVDYEVAFGEIGKVFEIVDHVP